MELSFKDKVLLMLSVQTTIQAVKKLDTELDTTTTIELLHDLNERLSIEVREEI